jgi:hypothetical protein
MHLLPFGMSHCRDCYNQLNLPGRAIAVFAEGNGSVNRYIWQSYKGVAHLGFCLTDSAKGEEVGAEALS